MTVEYGRIRPQLRGCIECGAVEAILKAAKLHERNYDPALVCTISVYLALWGTIPIFTSFSTDFGTLGADSIVLIQNDLSRPFST